MDMTIAVVPVAGLGPAPAGPSPAREMLPVGRKPVVAVRRGGIDPRRDRSRCCFVTGPGKASDRRTHFDLNGRSHPDAPESGKEELLAELAFERSAVQYFYTRQRQLTRPRPRRSVRQVVRRPAPLHRRAPAIPSSACHAESDVVRRMTRCFSNGTRWRVVAFERCRATRCRATGGGPGLRRVDIFELADVVENRRPTRRRATWPSPPGNAAVAGGLRRAREDSPRASGGEISAHRRDSRADSGRAVRRTGVRLTGGERRYDIGNFDAYFQAFVEFAWPTRAREGPAPPPGGPAPCSSRRTRA